MPINSIRCEKRSAGNSGRFQKNEDGHGEGKPYIASSAKGHAKAGVEKKDGVLLRRIVIGLDNPQIIDLSPICNFPVFFILFSAWASSRHSMYPMLVDRFRFFDKEKYSNPLGLRGKTLDL